MLGPYEIEKKVSEVNYQLKLPKGCRIYPVFYILLLKEALKNARLGTETITLAEDLDVYNIERILDSRSIRNKIEYLVK